PNQDSAGQFSAVADSSYGSHVVFQDGADGNVTYAYLVAGASSWSYSKAIFQLCSPLYPKCLDSDPTITVDHSTNDVYVAAALTLPQGSSGPPPSIIMIHKGLAQNWRDMSWSTVASNFQPLNLDITMIYTEPYSFLNGGPYNFDSYTWAQLGNGWQLNLPWMTRSNGPLFIHLWNGEGYTIPASFWNGNSGAFENHQGEQFRMERNSTDIVLYDKTGMSYRFD